MALNGDEWTEKVREVLRKHSPNAMPLTRTGGCNSTEADEIRTTGPQLLFPEALAPEAALSGLRLLAGCWEQSHEVSQNVAMREGSYWHAIAHRMEPDSANAAYWFRRVGEHAIFPALRERAAAILEHHAVRGWRLGAHWDPYLFLDWCDEARKKPGTREEQTALEMQGAEWELPFAWCAGKPATNT